MAIEVAKFELKTVQDASGLEACFARGQFAADEVIAVIGKTEGNGGVNDFTRILADQAFRRTLQRYGKRSEAEIASIPMVWSGGCDGVITPHATVFARNGKTGPASKSRLAIGTAMSAELLPEDIGRPAMVEKVAQAVKAAMRDALDIDGIYDAVRNAGLDLPARPRAEDLKGRLVNCFIKCEADRRGTLRGRRQIMLDDSDVHHHRHAKAAVGAVAAAAIGDPAVFVSVDAMHQGPQGGGPVIAIIDAGDWGWRHGACLVSCMHTGTPRDGDVTTNRYASTLRHVMSALAAIVALAAPASAQDKVKVGVFPVSSSLPYFVAVERGFFKEQNVEPEMVRLIGGPPNVAAMITNQIDASAVLVTIEGMKANIKKPGGAMYISGNSQNKT